MKRPRLTQKINEDSESAGEYEKSQTFEDTEGDKLGVARVTADFLGFDKGRKSPATHGNFQTRPMGVERNPINQTG
jgi:hypothetical protein